LTPAEQFAAEVLDAFAPALADVALGKTNAEIVRDAIEGVLKIIGGHLPEANAAVLLADLRAMKNAGGDVLAWIAAHAEPQRIEDFNSEGRG
jgi:hypothetical protein